ncbi:MAG: 30S ribosomal protein S8e [Nanoarchaeota archaeon]
MAISQYRSKRKPSSSKYVPSRKQKLNELGRLPSLTKLEPKRHRIIKTVAGNQKVRLLSCDYANVYNKDTKKSEKIKIKTIVENPANRQFIRRNIMTKGCIIETEKGKAKVTSRPGQDGTVNAVLV